MAVRLCFGKNGLGGGMASMINVRWVRVEFIWSMVQCILALSCGCIYVLCVQKRLYGEDVNCGGCVGRKKQRGGGACERTLTC